MRNMLLNEITNLEAELSINNGETLGVDAVIEDTETGLLNVTQSLRVGSRRQNQELQ
jgi:hypothetical protein